MPEPLSEDRFRAIVADAVAAAFARNISSQGPPPGPPGHSPQSSYGNGNNGGNGNASSNWRIEDLGYFNPDLADPADVPVKTISNHTHYRDVYVFIECLKDLQVIKGEELVGTTYMQSAGYCP